MTEESLDGSQRGTGGAKTLDNGIRVLKAVAAQPDGLTTTGVARATGIHRTVVYRLLSTLRSHSLVSQGKDARFRLGVGVVELASQLRSDLQSAAQPHMRKLAETTGATVHLTVLDGDDAVGITIVEPLSSDMHVAYRVGRRYPVTVGAAGLAILAGRAPMAGERPEVTAGRRVGYVASHGEIQRGAWGLAAPLPNGTEDAVASVGVVSLSPLDETHTAECVLAGARAIASSLPLPVRW
jgi:DNA-binding IclR family transcriptional regulator